MRIHIDSLEIYCIIGLLDFEREAQQRVLLDLTIDYSYEEGSFLDYSQATEIIQKHLKAAKYTLLEDALSGLKKLLLDTFHRIERLEIKITKPDILPNCHVGLSEIWISKPL